MFCVWLEELGRAHLVLAQAMHRGVDVKKNVDKLSKVRRRDTHVTAIRTIDVFTSTLFSHHPRIAVCLVFVFKIDKHKAYFVHN